MEPIDLHGRPPIEKETLGFAGDEHMPKKALVVDNDFFFVEFLADQLETRGYEVIKAYEAMEGISKLEEESVDLLFVDLIMPRVDGKQLIRFVRSRFSDAPLYIVALPILEQVDGLVGIDADFFLAKGPVEKMASHLEILMEKLEKRWAQVPSRETIFQTETLIPRQTTDELVQAVKFQEAIIEDTAVGIMVVDRSARVILSNPAALELLGKSYDEVLSRQVETLFSEDEKASLVGTLHKMIMKPETKKLPLSLHIDSRPVRVALSLLRMDGDPTGWVMALYPEM
jgi:PAS domain S-box-containing protein